MATSMKRTTKVAAVNEEVNAVKETKKEDRIFKPDDLIPCRSITAGELLMEGYKTHFVYRWADYDDIQEVEYQDLQYDVRIQGRSYSKYPRFIILDEDFIKQNPSLNEVYSKIYTLSDLRKIFDMSISEIKKTVAGLPSGARESLKTMVSTAVSNGTLDSINKIKVFDELFETDMFQTLFDA